jgi:hypothetical protein
MHLSSSDSSEFEKLSPVTLIGAWNMDDSTDSQRPNESNRFSAHTGASDISAEEILWDVTERFEVPAIRGGPVRLPDPMRLHVEWRGCHFCLKFKPSDTFAHVKRSLAVKCGFGFSWVMLKNCQSVDWAAGRGSRCFRDFDDASTLADSFIGCEADRFHDADAGLVLCSSHGPLRISTSRRRHFIGINLFGSDRVCEVKRRIEGHNGIAIRDQRILFDGRELPDDFTLEDLGRLDVKKTHCTILRLAVRLHRPIQIWIQHRNGERLGLEVDSSDLICELKERIESQEGILKREQRLFVGGKELVDGSLVCDWSIQSGFTVHLVCARAAFPEALNGQIGGDHPAANESIELLIHDLHSNHISSISVGRQEPFGDLSKHLGYGAGHYHFWLGDLWLHFDDTVEGFPIRSGTVIHLKVEFPIFVRMFDGQHVVFTVSPDDTIWDVKLAIEDHEGIPPSDQRLIFGRKQLDEDQTIADCRIRQDSTLHLALRLRG